MVVHRLHDAAGFDTASPLIGGLHSPFE